MDFSAFRCKVELVAPIGSSDRCGPVGLCATQWTLVARCGIDRLVDLVAQKSIGGQSRP